MTWTKLSDTFTDDADLLALDRDDRLLLVEATVYANRILSDGHIPRRSLLRFTDHPDPTAGMRALVGAGLVEETDLGWLIRNWTREQRARSEVEQIRARNRERQRIYRLHKAGVHAECDPKRCTDTTGSRHAVTDRATNAVTNAAPSRPVPTRREGTGVGEATPLTAPSHPYSDDEGVCNVCRLPESNLRHREAG